MNACQNEYLKKYLTKNITNLNSQYFEKYYNHNIYNKTAIKTIDSNNDDLVQ